MAPSRLTSIICRCSARCCELKGASIITPALFTRTSALPNSLRTRSAAATIDVSIGDVGVNGERAGAQLLGEFVQSIDASREKRESISLSGEHARPSLRRYPTRLR